LRKIRTVQGQKNIQSYKKIPFERFREEDKELKKYVDAVNKCNLGLSYQVM